MSRLSTSVTVVCPRCAAVVTLLLVEVTVAVGDVMEAAGTEVALSLRASVEAEGPHQCPWPDPPLT